MRSQKTSLLVGVLVGLGLAASILGIREYVVSRRDPARTSIETVQQPTSAADVSTTLARVIERENGRKIVNVVMAGVAR